ncbi:MAG: AAA family ATPase [Acidobacteria bacterium]|nr:AAA family ATPase [Acidobacteriota bacterium]
MKLTKVEIDNFRAIEQIHIPLDPSLTVLHGNNTLGKTSVLRAIAVGLSRIPEILPGVSGIDFLDTDVRLGESFAQVDLTTIDGHSWKRLRRIPDFLPPGPPPDDPRLQGIHKPMEDEDLASETETIGDYTLKDDLAKLVRADREANPPLDLPIVAFYDTDRAVLDVPEAWQNQAGDVPPDWINEALRGFAGSAKDLRTLSRYVALDGALTARAKYRQLLQWFRLKEDEELREQRNRRDFDHRQRDLSAVRRAIASMLDGVSEPHIDVRPLRFLVRQRVEGRRPKQLEIGQLSDGQRAVLALAADLARRMADGNPHLEDPLNSEAIVLIDEVELHLHPSWQQRILDDLRRTFPNAQFIVSTHSPQVLTTVAPQHIVELAREDGRIVVGAAAGWTFGAEAGDVLSVVMGVDERPDNDFSKKLARYRRLINDDEGESREALRLRQELEGLSPDDPALDRADVEIQRRQLLRKMGEST